MNYELLSKFMFNDNITSYESLVHEVAMSVIVCVETGEVVSFDDSVLDNIKSVIHNKFGKYLNDFDAFKKEVRNTVVTGLVLRS